MFRDVLLAIAIITPYRKSLQGSIQCIFYQQHTKVRSITERVFRMLKSHWGSLLFRAMEVWTTTLHQQSLLEAGDILKPVLDIDTTPVSSSRVERSDFAWKDSLAGQLPSTCEHRCLTGKQLLDTAFICYYVMLFAWIKWFVPSLCSWHLDPDLHPHLLLQNST